MKRTLPAAAVAVIAALTLSGCFGFGNGQSAPDAGSDSNQSYASGAKVPVDDNVYVITGQVSGQVNSLTRQVAPAHGSLSGPSCYGTSGCYGGTSASFFGPVESGKGFVRLLVNSAAPSTPDATPGDLVLLKVTDTKATALLPGDNVTFKCRRQYENVAAVLNNEKFNADKVATWELDYCRLASPEVQVSDK